MWISFDSYRLLKVYILSYGCDNVHCSQEKRFRSSKCPIGSKVVRTNIQRQMSLYTKFLSQTNELIPCSSARNWYLVLLRDTDDLTIHLLRKWSQKISEYSPDRVVFVVMLRADEGFDLDVIDFKTKNVVIVDVLNRRHRLPQNAVLGLFTMKPVMQMNENIVGDIDAQFNLYWAKRTGGVFGRCSDCFRLFIRNDKRLRHDLLLYRYSSENGVKLAFSKWKRRIVYRGTNRLLRYSRTSNRR